MLDFTTMMLKVIVVYVIIATVSSVSIISYQDLPITYNITVITTCPATHNQRDSIKQDIKVLLKSSVLPNFNHTENGQGYGICSCGGPGWRRATYLNMSDPTQTCPPEWELITTPRRSCARPSNAASQTCYSAMFPIQNIQYSQVCGRIIGYQVGSPQAFLNAGNSINDRYVDGVSLTYGSPRQHIWTFANALDEYPDTSYSFKCPCTNITEQHAINLPPFVGNDYFCETGVPPGQQWSYTFYADDPLWDGQGCGPTSTCCTFNNPPWFCKQLPQSTNTDLEVRLCSHDAASSGRVIENTPIELIEIYVK